MVIFVVPANVLNAVSSTLPNPKLVLAVAALFKSDKLFPITNLWPTEAKILSICDGESFNASANSFKVINFLLYKNHTLHFFY